MFALKNEPLQTDTTPQTAKTDTACIYSRQNLQVIPLRQHGKHPSFMWAGLQKMRVRWHNFTEHAERAFMPHYNIGFIAGKVSDGAFAIDCDTEPFYQRAKQAFIERFGMTHFTKSSKGGHILIRCTDATVKTTKISLNGATAGDIKGHNSIVVLPTSTKRLPNGDIYTYTLDSDTPRILSLSFADLADFLHDIAPGTKLERTTQARKRYKASTVNVLNGNVSDGNRHTELARAIPDVRRYNTEPYTRDKMTRAGIALGLPEHEVAKLVEYGLATFTRSHADNTTTTPLHEVAERLVYRITFNKRTAKTRRAVLRALIARSRQEVGKKEFVATYRQIQKLSGIASRNTVQSALDDLQAFGIIRKVTPKRRRHDVKPSSMWTWDREGLTDALRLSNATRLESGCSDNSKSRHKVNHKHVHAECLINSGSFFADFDNKVNHLAEHDSDNGAFFEHVMRHNKILGHALVDIYIYLLQCPDGAKTRDIADNLNIAQRTVRHYANKLKEHELIERDGYVLMATYDAERIEKTLDKLNAEDKLNRFAERLDTDTQVHLIDFIIRSLARTDSQHTHHIV